jgi:MerR family mercuric resistance operon transcriptional regulator
MRSMTVGQAARLAGVGVETVRFYEKRGLLEEPARRASGYRDYDDGTVSRLRFIRRAKELGFSLHEIKDLLSLRCSERPCNDVQARAEAKIAEIEEKVAMLLRMKEVLGRLATSCCEQGDKRRCPILETLEGDENARNGKNDSGRTDSSPLSRRRRRSLGSELRPLRGGS